MPITENDLRRHGAQAPVSPGIEAQLRLWIEQAPAEGTPGRRYSRQPARSVGRLRRAAPLIAIPVTAAVIAAAVIAAASLREKDPAPSPAATAAPTSGAPTPSATGSTGAAPVPTGNGILWRWLFTIDSPPPGWAVVQENFFTGHQDVILQGPSSAICVIQVFAAGAYDTGGIGADATPVTVNGTEGAFATSANGFNQVNPALSWQYAPGAYALSMCNQGTADAQGDALAVASALAAQQRPYTVPFSVGYLPSGFIPSMAQSSLVSSTRDPNSTLMVSGPPAPGVDQNSYQISLNVGEVDNRPGQNLTVNTPDGPRPAVFVGGILTVTYDGFTVGVSGGIPLATTPDELVRIAEGVDVVADPADRSTWLDAQGALP